MDKDLQYSKHKECGPEETVSRIRKILDICGIETQVLNERNQFEGAFSNRIVLKNLGVGTNGKGTTKAYALASGYAEFMERLENESLGHKLTDNDWAYFVQGEKKNSEGKEELTDKDLDQVAGGKFGDSNWDYVDCLMLCAD
ncbi:MAG: hypothetical protein IJH64_11510 [Oscillospiraceae bacterium]|nr:hypothetical protein [Oscillospiraceae bacterium]